MIACAMLWQFKFHTIFGAVQCDTCYSWLCVLLNHDQLPFDDIGLIPTLIV